MTFEKVEVSLGAVNTGAKFNASGLSDSEKELFAETDDLIKLDSNIFGGVAVIKNTKGKFENTISSISYKKNDDREEDTLDVEIRDFVSSNFKILRNVDWVREATYQDGTARYNLFFKIKKDSKWAN